MRGYHFTGDKLRNGEPLPPIGEWLEHSGPIIPGESGLHAAAHPFEALEYAFGPMLHLVDLQDDLVIYGSRMNKWVGRRRRIRQTIDATKLLRDFARWCALQVVDLWDAPIILRQYLETGDEKLRPAAHETTWDVEWNMAMYSARAATWDNPWDNACHAAWYASWDAARSAFRAILRNEGWDDGWDSDWDKARHSALDNIPDDVKNAIRNAARNAEWGSAWDNARDFFVDAQRAKLLELVEVVMGERCD